MSSPVQVSWPISPVGIRCVLLTTIKGRIVPKTTSDSSSTESATFDHTIRIADCTAECQPTTTLHFLTSFTELPLAGILEGIFGGLASWPSQSERVIDAEGSVATTGRSTPFTDRSDVLSVTTIETRVEQNGLSSAICALFGWKEDTSSRRVLEISEENSDRLVRPNNGLPCCLCSALKCKCSAGEGPELKSLGPLDIRQGIEIDLPTTNSCEETGEIVHDGGEAVQQGCAHLSQDSNNTAEGDEYWKWDQDIQQFVHTDRDTGKTIVCPDWFD